MKSYRDKAIGFMMELESHSNVEIKEHDFVNILDGIILLLKHQDRDTRHACAEAVLSCDGDMDADSKLICAADAHDACMRAKAG